MDDGTVLAPTRPRPGDTDLDSLRSRALSVYDDVVADPTTYGPLAADLADQARSAGLPEVLVVALRAQAWSERARLSNETGKALLDEAVRIARHHKFEDRLSELLVTRAAVNSELGRLIPAQRDLDAASKLSSVRTAELTFQQAVLYQNLGRLTRSGELYAQLLGDGGAPLEVQGKAANNYSILQMQSGHPDAAFSLVRRATDIAAQVGPALTAIVASTRAWITTQSGRLTTGMEEFAEAGRLLEAAGLPLAEHFLEYVDALADLRLIPEAHAVAEKAVAEFERHSVDLMTAEGLLGVAKLALLLNDLPRATSAARAARDRCAAQGRVSWRARADVVLADIALRCGQATPESLASVRRAAATLEHSGLVSQSVDAHLLAGRTAVALGRRSLGADHFARAAGSARDSTVLVRLKGRLASALAATGKDRLRHCRDALADLAQHRAAFASLELRVRASGHGAELGQLGLEVLLRTGTPAQLLSWMEHTRSAALIAVEPVGMPEIDDDLAALRSVEAELSASRRENGSEPAALIVRQRSIEDRIRRVTWTAQNRHSDAGHAASTADLRRALGSATLVEYGTLGDQLFAVVLGARRTTTVLLGSAAEVRKQVDMLLFALRRLARPPGVPAATAAARTSAQDVLRRLRALLFEPLGLAVDAPLVVSPTGALRRVPWSALREAPVSVVPAASFWVRTTSSAARSRTVLLVAGPDLPGAAAEVSALLQEHQDAAFLLPPNSTISAVLEALTTAELVHMACHGRLRVDNPAFSGLQLQDGLLTLHELEMRNVAPKRLILAACESAVDTSYEGNEVLGFVSALMARGTDALIASVVVIPDAAAVPLMRELHGRLREGDTFGDALFSARSRLDRSDPRAFVNWCAFNAYGGA